MDNIKECLRHSCEDSLMHVDKMYFGLYNACIRKGKPVYLLGISSLSTKYPGCREPFLFLFFQYRICISCLSIIIIFHKNSSNQFDWRIITNALFLCNHLRIFRLLSFQVAEDAARYFASVTVAILLALRL